MSKIKEKLSQNQFLLTAEITPPKGAGIKKFVQTAHLIGPHVDAINITDCQRSLVKMSSLAAARIILDLGYEPVFQMTCRDRNTIAIQADLMGAAALQIPNLLCLTGDPVKAGDSPSSKSVFEVESVQLLHLVKKLQNGRDQNDHKMNTPTHFCVGAAVNPSLQQSTSQMIRMEKKMQAGAQFFQTQANFDLDDFENFLEQATAKGAKILAGILILHSAKIAQYIHSNIPAIHFPEHTLKRFLSIPESDSKAGEDLGIELATQAMVRLAKKCVGFHLMSIRNEPIIPKVLEAYAKTRKNSF